MTDHVLKTLPQYWDAVEAGDKNFEVRRDDRGFQKGDTLILRRTDDKSPHIVDIKRHGAVDPTTQKWRDTECYDLRRQITWILTGGQFGIESGYVVLGLKEVE